MSVLSYLIYIYENKDMGNSLRSGSQTCVHEFPPVFPNPKPFEIVVLGPMDCDVGAVREFG